MPIFFLHFLYAAPSPLLVNHLADEMNSWEVGCDSFRIFNNVFWSLKYLAWRGKVVQYLSQQRRANKTAGWGRGMEGKKMNQGERCWEGGCWVGEEWGGGKNVTNTKRQRKCFCFFFKKENTMATGRHFGFVLLKGKIRGLSNGKHKFNKLVRHCKIL